MTRAAPTLILTTLLLAASSAHAQRRPVHRVAELNDGILSRLLLGQRGAVERCAARGDTGAFVTEVRARVRPGPSPSTMHEARIRLRVRSRPRDGSFEACVRRAVTDALHHTAYAVGPRGARARHTFRIADRPEPPPERPPPPYSAAEVHRVLNANTRSLMRCLERGGVMEPVTLRVGVRPDGRLVLTSADLPSDASRHALGCMARRVSRLRVSGRPRRRVALVHRIGAR